MTSPNDQGASAQFTGPVAYIMSRYPLLTETFILREMLELERQGVTLAVFPLLRAKQKVRHPEVDQLKAPVYYTPFLSPAIIAANLRQLLHRPGRYLKLLWTVLRNNAGSRNALIGAIGIFPKSVYIAEQAKRLGIRHVHAHFATHPTLSALIIHRLCGISYSCTAHAHDIFIKPQMLSHKFREASFVATVSHFNIEHLRRIETHLDLHKIKVIRCGIDVGRYGAFKASSVNKPLLAVCVAGLKVYKGLQYLVRSVPHIILKVPNFKCIVIGEGEERARLEELIEKLGVQDHIHLLGGMQQDEVAKLLSSADLFVLPSIVAPSGQMEGVPVALMEAMASGLPVVSTRISGIPELVCSGQSGILVEPEDEVALAHSIVTLCEDEPLRRRMGELGRGRVLGEYQLGTNVARLRELFAQAVEDAATEKPLSAARQPPC